MWQYTTETIINSNKGNLAGLNGAKVRACAYDNKGVAKAAVSADSDILLIDGVGSFIKKYVSKVAKYAYRAAENAKLEIDLANATIAAGDVIRLTVALREEGRQSSIMQDAYLHHSKPFHFEVEAESAQASDLAAKLEKAIKKMMAMSDFKFFSAEANGDVLVLEGSDCHIRFIEDALRLDQIEPASGAPAYAKITGFENFVAIGADFNLVKEGDCGAGTVEHLIKDLRIPTGASINPFGADHGGKPVPGGEYTQYLIEYETPRNHVAHGVMGSVAEKSRTSHVIFVESAAVASVGALIESLGTPEVVAKASPAAPKQEPGSVQ